VSGSFVFVDDSLEAPPYRQVFEQVRAAIERGELPPGAVLPTVRRLADDLNVAPNTVARAYSELQVEGWLVSDGRRGTRVSPAPPASGGRERTRTLRDAIAKFLDSLRHRGFTASEIAGALQEVRDG
jgi:GntR family transcriptional regulator